MPDRTDLIDLVAPAGISVAAIFEGEATAFVSAQADAAVVRQRKLAEAKEREEAAKADREEERRLAKLIRAAWDAFEAAGKAQRDSQSGGNDADEAAQGHEADEEPAG